MTRETFVAIVRKTGFLFVLLIACVGSAIAQTAEKGAEDEALIELARTPWKGDLDGIVKRGYVRVLTAFNPLWFDYNGIDRSGLAVAMAKQLEKYLRKELGRPARYLNVILIVRPRDELIPWLREGRGDIVAANLTVTPARQKLVDFSIPSTSDIRELVVTGSAGKEIRTFDDLAKAGLYLRKSSSYFEHVARLNEERRKKRLARIPVETADERLEDYDLLEMVASGIVPAIVVDSHKIGLWKPIFGDDITVLENLAVNEGGEIAYAIRQNSPKLLEALNGFVRTTRKGTLIGNIFWKRYLTQERIENNLSPEARRRFETIADHMRKYGGEYGFDWLMIAAQGFQESRLDQEKRSNKGAVGIMQLLPSTASDPNVGIRDIHIAEKNIHAGVKYLRHLRETYFNDPEISSLDRVLFSFAAYNAGPGNMAKARRRAEKMGLNRNRWFENVETAMARVVSREPVIYVRNIFKYYVSYKKLHLARAGREEARGAEERK